MAKKAPKYGKRDSINAMLKIAEDYDSMYREGYDGYIGVHVVPADDADSGKCLEMITILDISNLLEEQVDTAVELASAYQKLHHENILNFLIETYFIIYDP